MKNDIFVIYAIVLLENADFITVSRDILKTEYNRHYYKPFTYKTYSSYIRVDNVSENIKDFIKKNGIYSNEGGWVFETNKLIQL